MSKPVPNIDFSWLSKRKTLYCLSFNKSMGLDPFNSKALELLLAAISHSESKWGKWGETQQHHSIIHQRELRVEVGTGGRARQKRVRPLFMHLTDSRTAVCIPVTGSFIHEARLRSLDKAIFSKIIQVEAKEY